MVGYLAQVRKAHGAGIGLQVVHEPKQLIQSRTGVGISLQFTQVPAHGVVVLQGFGHEQLPVFLVARFH